MAGANYHIYIHDKTKGNYKSGGAKKPTQPTSPIDTPSGGEGGGSGGGGGTSPFFPSGGREKPFTPSSIIKFVENPTGSVLNMLSQAYPVVKVGVEVAKFAIKVADTTIAYFSTEAGNFGTQIRMSNLKQTFTNLTKPVSAILNAVKYNQELRLTNQRYSEQRLLLGDSLINNGVKNI